MAEQLIRTSFKQANGADRRGTTGLGGSRVDVEGLLPARLDGLER
jgi:hypothetical protein